MPRDGLNGFTRISPIYNYESNEKKILPNFWVYGVLSDNKIDAIMKFRDMGYYASGVHSPNNYYTIFGNQEKLPGVDEFYSKFLAIPCGWWFQLNENLNV